MREILFRGKRKDNGEWVEGDLIFSRNTAYIHPKANAFSVTESGLRCKDCKYYHNSGYCTRIGMPEDRFANDYCSYGERKENEK